MHTETPVDQARGFLFLGMSTLRGGLSAGTPRPFYSEKAMEIKIVRLAIPENGNVILGHSHFIKTVEDLYEAIVNTVPQMKFGIAFNEASGACLIRVDGNDRNSKASPPKMRKPSPRDTFVIAMRDGYPINILGRIHEIPEVCNIFCATANPVEVILAETEQGRGIMGVIDGSAAQRIESANGPRVAPRPAAQDRI